MASRSDIPSARAVYDLAHDLYRGMPVSPNHPPYQMALIRRHGDHVRPGGGSAANELIVTGGHVGTHIDALGHVSQGGLLHGGIDAASVSGQHGLAELGVETIDPIVGRGVLIDIAALHGVDCLEPTHEVTAEELEEATRAAGVEVAGGDSVLIRTGWAIHWDDPEVFGGQRGGAPGPGPEAARWLAERKVCLVGGETIAFEVIRPGEGHRDLPVHQIMLYEAGIHIIEVMDLSSLSEAGVHEFVFVVAPLKLVGATGSPVRPLAIVYD